MEDIAIVGIGLRFPGDAANPEKLWSVLERGESQWREFPEDRLNIDGYYHPGGNRQGSISFRGAHFLKDDFAAFDAPFFSVTAEDAKAIDPQQRILLEASFEALENAGIRKEDIDDSDAAVYVGSFVKDYEQVCLRDPDWQPQYAATGNGIAIMANRISYFLNLHGPSMTIDTGCSGSLVSIHLAAQSLRAGETSLAIAAGAGMILTPNTIMPMTALNFLSPDGKCFTFDARANGYGRGEGIGVVIMKRLTDAIRDNDTIRAVIRGTRVNQDGHTTGITLPSEEAQIANISALYESAGLDFSQTGYVECHGTGTQAGDWRELKAISETLGSVRSVDSPIIVGSVKPNIGHLEGAAGVAGLIKGVLILEHGKIPPNINFENGNPDIDFEKWRVKVPRSMMDWPLPGLRRVSINCFGFGGTNAHVILDEAPMYLSARGLRGNHNSFEGKHVPKELPEIDFEPQLFCYSSHEKAGVCRVMNSHLPYLTSKGEDTSMNLLSSKFLHNYAYTLNCRRSILEWKHLVIATSLPDLISKIQSAEESSFCRTSKAKQLSLCFVFSGQGAQFAQMGQDLMSFTPFRQSLEAASLYMKKTLNSTFDLLEEILKDSTQSRISDPEFSQPATTALQIALIDLLESLDIKPGCVIGHSSGEVAAAFAAGALTRENAWEIAYFRGLASSRVYLNTPGLNGAMMVVGMSLSRTETYLKSRNQDVEVACVNSPRSITISGAAKAIQQISADLRDKNIFCRVLSVNTAYHSSHMKTVEDQYKRMLEHISPLESQSAIMFSSVTGEVVANSSLDNRYWAKNMVSRVQYVDAVQTMLSLPVEQRPDMIIELSPRAALKSPTLDILSEIAYGTAPAYHSVLGPLHPPQHGSISLLNLVGELWIQGFPVNMKSFMSRGSDQATLKCLADLPPYPWNHSKSYWHESHLGRANRFREFPRQDLIGAPTADAISFEPRWRGFLRISENPWIQDHQVQKTIVYPAAGMISMALEGANQMTKDKYNLLGYEITNMRIEKAMIIPTTSHGLEMAMNMKRIPSLPNRQDQNDSFEFAIYSKQLDSPWEQNARGSLQVRYKQGDWKGMFRQYQRQHESMKATCKESLIPRQLYELLDIVGMSYGSLFQNITEISKGNNSCISKIRVPDTKSKMPAKFEYPHLIHPATLDAMFQTLFAIDNEPMVPTYIGSLFVSADISQEIGSEFIGYATADRTCIRDAKANIVMTQVDFQHPTVVIDGLHFTVISNPSSGTGGFLPNNRNLCTQVVWAEDLDFSRTTELQHILKLLAHKYPGMSILQVGGTPGLSYSVLKILEPDSGQTPWLSRYTIAQGPNNDTFLDVLSGAQGTPLEPFIETRLVDGSEPLPEYDLLLVCEYEGINLYDLKRRIKAGGLILEQNPDLSRLEVSHTYEEHGELIYMEFQKQHQPLEKGSFGTLEIIVLLPNFCYSKPMKLVTNLTEIVRSRQPEHIITYMRADEVLDNLKYIKRSIVISLLDFVDDQRLPGSVFEWSEDEFLRFHALQKLAKGIIWVTQGAHMKPLNPRASPIIALSRTLISEDSLKSIVTLDLGIDTEVDDFGLALNIFFLLNNTFTTTQGLRPREMEYAEEHGKIFIPRLVPISPLNRIVENDSPHEVTTGPFHNNQKISKLQIVQSGLVDDGLLFSSTDSSSPNQGEIEVIFDRAVVTNADVEIVMGRTIETRIGFDVSGSVGRVGSEVLSFNRGEKVVAIAIDGAFNSSRNFDSRFVKRWSSILPLSHCVLAYHALSRVGRLGYGRKVMIHAGASSFGLAAIKVALQLGTEIFATVLGPRIDEQRIALEQNGLVHDHILEADSDSFVKVIRNMTGGKGVDLVYNSIQRHVEANFGCIRKGGTIFQFSNKSPCAPAVQMTSSSISFISFDFVQIIKDDPEFVAELLDETIQFVEDTGFVFKMDADFVRVIDLANIEDAFRMVKDSPYLGIVEVFGGPRTGTMVKVMAPKLTKSLHDALCEDKSYLLAGGLGGLGRSICDLLISNGVKHLVFLSRSGASTEASVNFIDYLEQKGVRIRVYQVDICDADALQKVVAEQIRVEMPPIAGVFQCAAVIKDVVFDNMTYSDWITAFKPKSIGSENLLEIIPSSDNDPFFIFLASSAGVIGNRGQANYAAGNCYMDALARNYRLRGKHAVSIDLGPVLGAGMLAEDEEILDMLRASGFYGIRHQDFLTMVTHAITMEISASIPMPPQVIMGIGTGGLVRQNQPADPYWSRTALYGYLNLVDMPPPDLSIVDGSSKMDMKSKLACCLDSGSAAGIVCTGLTHMLAKAMNMLPEEIDSGKPPNAYGVDSLVAVGVRNWVFNNCGVEVSVFEVLSDKTVAELAAEISEKGGFGVEKN